MTSLSNLSTGQKARIIHFEASEKICMRFMEMGLRVNDSIQILERLYGGILIVLSEHGKYALRKREARLIKTNAKFTV